MKIERFLYGMIDGKIYLLKTNGVNKLLSDKNFQYLRNLKEEDSDKYLWLPTEQVIALPHIKTVSDDNGRTWVQNQTLLIPIHDYIKLTKPHEIFHKFFESVLNKPPEVFERIKVE